MDEQRQMRTEQILQGLDDTRVQTALADREYELDFLDDDTMPLKEQQRRLREQLDAVSDRALNDLYLDVARATAPDRARDVHLKFVARTEELWKGAVSKIEDDAAYIKNVLAPAVDNLHKSGNMAGYRDKLQELEAASVALATSVNQRQGDVREMLRKELYEDVPYLDRATRHQILNDATRLGETPNGRMFSPPAVTEATRAVVQLRQTIANRTRDKDDDLDVLLAARRDITPRP